MTRILLLFLLLLGLGCSGLGGPNIEGVWCTQKDTWSCWAFEGDTVSYVWMRDKLGQEPESASFRVEENSILIKWKSNTQILKIVDKTASTMQFYDVERKVTHTLIKVGVLPKPGDRR